LLRAQLETEKNGEIERLNGSLTEKEDILVKQAEQLRQLEGKLNAQKDYEKIKNSLEQSRSKNTELEKQFSTLQEKNDDLEGQLLTFDEIQEELENLQRQLEELKRLNSVQAIKIEELENESAETENRHKKELKQVQEELLVEQSKECINCPQLTEGMQELESRIKEIETDSQAKSEQVIQLASKLQSNREIINQLNQERSELEKICDKLISELETIKQERDSRPGITHQQFEELKTRRDETEKKNQELNNKVSSLTNKAENEKLFFEQQIRELSSSLDKESDENKRLSEKLATKARENDELTRKLAESEKNRKAAEQSTTDSRGEIDLINKNTKELERLLNARPTQKDFEELENSYDNLRKENEEFVNAIKEAGRLREQIEQENSNREEQLISKINRISIELNNSNKKISELTSERDAAQTALGNRAEITPDQLITLNQKIAITQQKVIQLEQERDVINTELTRLQKDLSAVNENNRINKNKIEIQKVQITTQENQISDLQSKASQSQKELNSLRKAETQLQKNNVSLVSELKREKTA
jgi:chromosome segregation ATPase